MTDVKSDQAKTMAKEDGQDRGRRHFLRTGLAAVAGLACGYSMLTGEVLAKEAVKATRMKATAIKLPAKLDFSEVSAKKRVFKPQSQTQLVNSITPMLEHIVQGAGFNLNQTQISKLQKSFAERGMIDIPAQGGAAGFSVSLAGSVNYD